MNFPPITDCTYKDTSVQILRWDLNDHNISGNKLEKLAWHRELITEESVLNVLSMGGPWSNHLHALGALLQQLQGLKAQVIIRGEKLDTPSPTLKDLTDWGIRQHFISRQDYRQLREMSRQHFTPPATHCINRAFNKTEYGHLPGLTDVLTAFKPVYERRLLAHISFTCQQSRSFMPKHGYPLLNKNFLALSKSVENGAKKKYIDAYHYHTTDDQHQIALDQSSWWIPEGGDNSLSLWSIAAWAKQLTQHLEHSATKPQGWIVPVGSGTTFKGLLAGALLANTSQPRLIIGVPVFKNSLYLEKQIQRFIDEWLPEKSLNSLGNFSNKSWQLWHNHHWGGFGKYPQALKNQHEQLEALFHSPLDRVYTLKTASALVNKIDQAQQENPSSVLSTIKSWLFFHTGGLQGNR